MDYTLRALLELADNYSQGEPLQGRQIAASQNVPERYLEQLLATLRRAGLVRSQRGARGGYLLARDPQEISLLEVLDSLQGLDSQGETSPQLTLEGLVIREVWQEVSQVLRECLAGHTLQQLADRRDSRRHLAIMYYI